MPLLSCDGLGAAVFLYGDTATGKTAVVRELCSSLALPHAYVNCVETYSPKLVFEHVLNQVRTLVSSWHHAPARGKADASQLPTLLLHTTDFGMPTVA